MRYQSYQKFFGKMVKIKEMSFLSTKGMGLIDVRKLYNHVVLFISKGALVSFNGVSYHFWLSEEKCLNALFLDKNGNWKDVLEKPLYCNQNISTTIVGVVPYTQSACPSTKSDYC